MNIRLPLQDSDEFLFSSCGILIGGKCGRLQNGSSWAQVEDGQRCQVDNGRTLVQAVLAAIAAHMNEPPPMTHEHMLNDLRELVADLDRFRERLVTSLEQQAAKGTMDPAAAAKWDGAFAMLRFSVLGERLLPMLEHWEAGRGFYRSTEKMQEK